MAKILPLAAQPQLDHWCVTRRLMQAAGGDASRVTVNTSSAQPAGRRH